MRICCRKDPLIRRNIVVCGDEACGKTTLLSVLTRDYFPQVYDPAVFDTYVQEIAVGHHEIELTMWDISDKPEPDLEAEVLSEADPDEPAWVRSLPPNGTHIIAICYAVDNPLSLSHAKTKWYKEMTARCPHAKIVLVALKCDLRDFDPSPGQSVQYEEGLAAARQIDAIRYLECSAKHNRGVHDCFTHIAHVAAPIRIKKSGHHLRYARRLLW